MSLTLTYANTLNTEFVAAYACLHYTTLPQSPLYVLSLNKTAGYNSQYIVIKGKNGVIGCAVLLLKPLHFGFRAVLLDRGPLWISGHGSDEECQQFWHQINEKYKAGFFTRRRFIPECSDKIKVLKPNQQMGGYETLLLNLTKSEHEWHAALRKDWQKNLQKAQQKNTAVKWGGLELWPQFQAGFLAHQQHKNYFIREMKLQLQLIKEAALSGDLFIAAAFENNTMVAAMLFIAHGNTATYQQGWTGVAGRRILAHHLLLWQSMSSLKERGIKWLDIGGLMENEQDEKFSFFKQSLNAGTPCHAHVRLMGAYR